ncbi:MAG: hypothetical protein R8K53_05025 [Mariprofundaceae bacterium]
MPTNTPVDKQKRDLGSTDKTDESALLARRRLLKLGAYVPPAIVGMAMIGSMPKAAHAAVGSCLPSSCQPCVDSDDDDTYNGKHPHDEDVRSCKIEKTKKKIKDKRKRKKHHS